MRHRFRLLPVMMFCTFMLAMTQCTKEQVRPKELIKMEEKLKNLTEESTALLAQSEKEDLDSGTVNAISQKRALIDSRIKRLRLRIKRYQQKHTPLQ